MLRLPSTVVSGLMVALLLHFDTLLKRDGAWLFAESLLHVDWVDERARS